MRRPFAPAVACMAVAAFAGFATFATPLCAADKADAWRVGTLVTPALFQPVQMPRSFANDRIRDALELPDSGPVPAYEVDLNGDGQPERLLVGAEKLCGTGGCPYTLLDGKTHKEIGSFFGTLILLDRKAGNWSVIQTLGREEDGLRPLNTYTFQRVRYLADDAVMIDAAAFDLLIDSLRIR